MDPATAAAASSALRTAAANRAGGGGDQGAGNRLIAGVLAGLLALLIFVCMPVVLLTAVLPGECEGASEGVADALDLGQLEVARRIVDAGDSLRAPERLHLAGLATGLVESELRNLDHGPQGSIGVFQQRNFAPWTDRGRNRLNVRDAALSFYEIAKRKDRPGLTIGQLAQAVQGSGHPDKYDPRVPEARAIYARIRGGAGGPASASAGRSLPAATVLAVAPARGPAGAVVELAWPTQAQSITSPWGSRSSPCVGCSSFHEGLDIGAPAGAAIGAAAGGVVVQRGWVGGYGNYVCVRHAPRFSTCYAHLSRYGRFQIGNPVAQGDVLGYVGSTGVGTGAHLHFEVRTSGTAADPSVNPVPFLEGAAAGPTGAAGTSASCGGDDDAGLAEGTAPLTSGPAGELTGGVVAAPASAPGPVRRMVAAGNAIQHLPYTWGGGHNAGLRPSPGFDCSGAVSYVLHKAGVLDGALSSGDFARWGEPGPGRWVSVYSHNGHVFMVIAGQRLDTSAAGSTVNSQRGPRWRGRAPRSSAGFTVTHPPGL